jgi:transcriptional regulator with XRE-family HTH domain
LNIHDNIKNARIKAGLTQTELALAIGVTQKEISRWETGSRTPQVETFASICKALNVSADVLLETGIK